MKTIKELQLTVTRHKVAEGHAPYNTTVTNPAVVAAVVRQLTTDKDREFFYVFLLDVKNKIIGYVEVARGSVDQCTVDPREVFRAAVFMGASGLIAAHNHPSGDTTPSQADDLLTKRLTDGGKLLGFAMLDHLIVTADGCYSYAEKGRI